MQRAFDLASVVARHPGRRARLRRLPRPLLQGGQPLVEKFSGRITAPSELPGGVLPASRLRAPARVETARAGDEPRHESWS